MAGPPRYLDGHPALRPSAPTIRAAITADFEPPIETLLEVPIRPCENGSVRAPRLLDAPFGRPSPHPRFVKLDNADFEE
jgi:hypothetical protein